MQLQRVQKMALQAGRISIPWFTPRIGKVPIRRATLGFTPPKIKFVVGISAHPTSEDTTNSHRRLC